MDAERPASITLRAYGFKITKIEAVRDDGLLAHLLRAIGNKPLSFARSNTLGIGITVARDELGRLWTIDGQYHLSSHGLRDHTPEHPHRTSPKKHTQNGAP